MKYIKKIIQNYLNRPKLFDILPTFILRNIKNNLTNVINEKNKDHNILFNNL